MSEKLTLTVQAEEGGTRMDSLLAGRLADRSRSRLKALIEAGRVSVDGAVITEPSHRVKPGQRLLVDVPLPVSAVPEPEPIALDVLFEDEHLLVLDKPAGLVVHPAPGHASGTLVNALLAHCGESLSGIGGVRRPGIVHRLDKDVSGLMAVAKHDRAHVGLAGQLSVHSVERVYEAIVWGVPARAKGRIDAPIGRHPRDRVRMAVVPGGKRAVTRWRLLAAAGTLASTIELRLETGRTHQIRVHLGTLGLGIVGDPLYRPRRRPRPSPALQAVLEGFGRIALHARVLGFRHPVTGEALRFERPPPACFSRLLDALTAEANLLTTR